LYGFGEGRGIGSVARERGEGGGREEMQAEGEVGGGEDGEGFDEDGGDGFFAGEGRVELVATCERSSCQQSDNEDVVADKNVWVMLVR